MKESAKPFGLRKSIFNFKEMNYYEKLFAEQK